MWLLHPGFIDFVKGIWEEPVAGSPLLVLFLKLKRLRGTLRKWNREVFGNVHQQVKDAEDCVCRIEVAYDQSPNEGAKEELEEDRKILEGVLLQEEIFWKQKSRVSWLKEGDRNIKFFHSMVNIRRRQARVDKIKGADGEWICDPEGVQAEAIIVSRLVGLLSPLVEAEQGAFVKGRCIHDNISIVQEVAQDLNRKTRRGNVILKLDMAKAYDRYEGFSRQLVNRQKSCFVLGRKASLARAHMIGVVTGFPRKTLPITYLGAPLYAGRLKICFFDDMVGKIRNKVAGWKGKLLSTGGRVTLLKHVLSSIPIHVLATLIPPKAVIRRLYGIFADFLWGCSEWGKRRHWVCWRKFCRPLQEGGLGVRLLEDVGLSLRLKGLWKVFTEDSLWSEFFRAKYFRNSHVVLAGVQGVGSKVWRSTLAFKEFLLNRSKWLLGSSNISFWLGNWTGAGPLLDHVDNALQIDLDLRIKDALDEDGAWRQEILDAINSVAARDSVVLHNFAPSGRCDVLAWTPSTGGSFTTKST
ncbi:uncharacterized protein LOC122640174 [Telopea speciosissima]|uniref:uncharacterized protein LOC122640174 n=1 Tax=Telopea speciosissima TaxID=54955 RepID=UPI001CC59BBF|nr:uncharacterized protein LOC122640174 [Telopea speciosissima]